MKKLYSLIITSYIGPFLATFFIVLFILVMQFLWLYIDDLVGKGLEWYIIAELLFYASAHLVPMALPLAILLSSIMTFGNLGENYELVALKSSGLSLIKIMMPLIIVSVLTSFGAFYFANNIWPVANLQFKTLLYDIQHKKPTIDIKPGIFYRGIDGYVIRIGEKDEKGVMLYNMLIYDHTKLQGATKVISAEKGKMEMSEDQQYLNLILYNGHSYDEIKDKEMDDAKYPHVRVKFNEEIIRFNLTGFNLERTKDDLFTNNYQMLSVGQLDETIDSLMISYKDRAASGNDLLREKFVIWRDSIDRQKLVNPMDTGEAKTLITDIMSDAGPQNALEIVEMATNIARSAKTNITRLNLDLTNRKEYIMKHRVEWHRKFTLAFSCIVLFFIGAPLGAIIRKGGFGLPVVTAVFGFLVFYLLNIVGEKLTKEGGLLPYQGMWLSSFVLFPISLFLTYKSTNDSAIFEGSTYITLIRNFTNKLRALAKTSQ